jgi:hypothetical protein
MTALGMLLAAVALAVLAAPLSAAIRPASRPVDPLATRAREMAREKQLAPFAEEMAIKLRTELERGADAMNLAEVVRLASWREFGRYFARVNELTEGQSETLIWLAGQPDVLPALIMAVTDGDPPDRVLASKCFPIWRRPSASCGMRRSASVPTKTRRSTLPSRAACSSISSATPIAWPSIRAGCRLICSFTSSIFT